MSVGRILYINFAQAESGALADVDLRRDYVLACRFMHCGIVDRTATLDLGFAYAAVDPIPEPSVGGATFADLCDAVGTEIVDDASRLGREVRVLWSGGIDSTTALIAVIKAAEARGYARNVRVLLSLDSVHENPAFFLQHIDGKYEIATAAYPISAAIVLFSLGAFSSVIAVALAVVFALGAVVARSLKPSGREAHQV